MGRPGEKDGGAHDLRPVYAAALLGYLLLLPPQFILQLGDLVLPPYRLFLIPAFFFVVARIASGSFRLTMPDMLVAAAAGWIFLALAVTMGPARSINSGGAQFIDIALSYLFARCAFASLRDLRIFLLLMAPALLATGLLMAVESVGQRYYGQTLAGSLVGRPLDTQGLGFDIRLGLMRAPGPFPHPILAGIFLGSFLALFAFSGLRGWPRIAGIAAAICSIFSISSAAFLALAAGLALMVYDRVVERIGNLSWRLFIAGFGIILFVAQFATQSGAIGLLTRFGSINEWSAYYRRLIWRFGSESVVANPLFGIGYADWDRPSWMTSSVDNFWLLLAMQFGLLPAIALLAAAVLAVVQAGRASAAYNVLDRRLMRALAISLGLFALGAFSVSLWLSAQVWFFMLLGIVVTLSSMPALRLPVRTPAALSANAA